MTKPDRSRQSDDLSPAQSVAVDLIAEGRNDSEVAEAVKVTRQTVNEWRHHHPAFVAAVNARRREAWEDSRDRLRHLSTKAVGVLERCMEHPLSPKGLPAALAVLKAVAALPAPAGPVTPEGVLRAVAEARVSAEDAAIPMGKVDSLLAEMGEDRPRRVAEMMERIRREGPG